MCNEPPVDSALTDYLEWVRANSHVEEIAVFLAAFRAREGKTLYEYADEEPDAAFEVCESLFWMMEQTPEDEDMIIHRHFKRVQPKPQADPRQLL